MNQFSERTGPEDVEVEAAQGPQTSTAWLVFVFVLSLLYLFPEFAFNALLTDVAGGPDSTAEDLRKVELFGRTISGIGVALLISDFFIRKSGARSFGGAILIFLALLMFIWPLVFFGQKLLVDKLIVNSSSAEQRQHAVFAQLLRKALIENSIQIEGIRYEPDHTLTSEEKTFLAVISGLVYADKSLIQSLENRKREIVNKFVRDYVMNDFNHYYSEYNTFRKQLRDNYVAYRKNSKKYNQAMASHSQRSEKHWLAIENEVRTGWNKYGKAEDAFEARIDVRAQEIAPKVFDYIENENRCYDHSSDARQEYCLNKLREAYDREFSSFKGVPYIEPNEWLLRKEISALDNAVAATLMGVLTGGVSTAIQLLSIASGGDGGIQNHKYVATMDFNHYKSVLRMKMDGQFRSESSGYSLGIESLHEFRLHPVTSKKIRSFLKKKNVIVGSDWELAKRDEFNQAVKVEVGKEAEKQWNESTRREGLAIRPNLSWQAFQNNTAIQGRIRKVLGEYYVSQTSADWNNIQFKKNIIDVNIARKTDELVGLIEAEKAQFEDGRSFEDSGKEAIRATVIPPISMFLSLFLVIMTVVKLPARFIEAFGLNMKIPAIKSIDKFGLSPGMVGTILLVMAILLAPVFTIANKYTAEDSSTHYFLEKVEDESSFLTSFALKWLLSTQPLFQPLGLSIDNSLKISTGFSKVLPYLDTFDSSVYSAEHYAKTETEGSKALVPLLITTNKPNARIMVMNIKPRYWPNMLLKEGFYDIKVIDENSRQVRKWVHLKKDKNRFEFEF